jgi:hypothetical protein
LLIIALNDTNLGKKSCTFVVNEAFTILGHVIIQLQLDMEMEIILSQKQFGIGIYSTMMEWMKVIHLSSMKVKRSFPAILVKES